MINLVALHGRGLRVPLGWDAQDPDGCWNRAAPSADDGVRWFNSADEAFDFAWTLEWWVLSAPFTGLWRVEPMDGPR